MASEIKPLEEKIEAIATKAGGEGADLGTAVEDVKSGIEELKALGSELEGKASTEDVDAMAKKVSESISTSAASSEKLTTAYKAAAKNQKYLKRIYKDLHFAGSA